MVRSNVNDPKITQVPAHSCFPDPSTPGLHTNRDLINGPEDNVYILGRLNNFTKALTIDDQRGPVERGMA